MSAADPAHDVPIDLSMLDEASGRVTRSILDDHRTHRTSTAFLPDRDEAIVILERLGWILFPGFQGPRGLSRSGMRDHVRSVLGDLAPRLARQLSAAFRYERRVEEGSPLFDQRCAECERRAGQVLSSFLEQLPEIRRMLSLDVQAAYDGDPAAHHVDEVIFCYPGIRALAVHRIAHALSRLQVPLLPRMMAEHAHSLTGIDIHPGARIGRSFFIDHGTGVVVGETTVIGDHCRIYQGVTLGAAAFEKDETGKMVRGAKRHPTLEDHVIVYAGATILGGSTVIGAGSVINGGVFLTTSVPPGHVVRAPRVDVTLRSNPEMPPAMFAI